MALRFIGSQAFALAILVSFGSAFYAAEPKIEKSRAGSHLYGLPPGAKGPPETIYVTENAPRHIPTNDWWSSLLWMPFSERHFPHPLALNAEPGGLRTFYPGANITANESAIFAGMPVSGEDFVLGHSAVERFPEKRVDGWSDWFVNVRFGEKGKSLRVSYGHGSPYVFAIYEGGRPTITFAEPPKISSGDEKSAVLALAIGNRRYALFGPTGSKWTGLGTKVLTNESSQPYFSVAVLPDDKPATLELFRKHAYTHVIDTKVSWRYDAAQSLVTTTFNYETRPYEGAELRTLFALYPHQWRNTKTELLGPEYNSVRGKMKLATGMYFRTSHVFPGVLPTLPPLETIDRERLARLLQRDVEPEMPPVRDTYAEGKWLGRTATLAEIADAYGFEEQKSRLDRRLRERLEFWFTSSDSSSKSKSQGLFAYEKRWGTLIGYPASFGSDTELNDHHFHYGYFIRAAASVGLRDDDWATDFRQGGLVGILVGEIAAPSRHHPLFPFLRNFDPYAGHSWASGHAKFGDGNNNESSSEAMNAWCGIVLLGEVTGNSGLRDLGIYLYATELAAIEQYWFDVKNENRPKEYTPSVVTMVWGGKGANGTWFSGDPEMVHGINWLPWHGGSGYLGRYPEYAAKNYAAMVKEKGDTKWRNWADILWLYRGLSDPADALAQFEAGVETTKFEAGNSRANTYVWLKSLAEYGQVDASITADTPLYAVFRQGDLRTYIAYNAAKEPRTITFSDGTKLDAANRGYVIKRAPIPKPK